MITNDPNQQQQPIVNGSTIVSGTSSEENSGGLDFQTIVNIFLGKWHVFLICAFVALLIGAAYIWHSPKIYTQQASVLVKDQKNGVGAGAGSAFADIAGFSGLTTSNVKNELQILASRSVMIEVIKRLGLQYTYFEPRFMREDELYISSPVYIIPSDPDQSVYGAAFEVQFLSESDTTQFKYVSEDTTFVCPFDQEVELPGIGLATVQLRRHTFDDYYQNRAHSVKVYAGNLDRVATGYMKGLSVDLTQKDGAMLQLSYQATSPRKAADILNTLIEEYNRLTIESKNEVLTTTLGFIAQRMEVVRKELNAVDAKLEGMKSSEKTVNPLTEASGYLTLSKTQEVQMSELEVQLRIIKDLRSCIDTSYLKLLPMNVALNSQVLNSQIQAYDEGLMRYNQLKSYSSENSPVVLDKATELNSLYSNIRNTAADVQAGIELQLKEVQRLSDKNMSRVSNATSNERLLTSISREQVVKSELYNYLLQKSEENAIMKSMTESNVRLIDSAWGSPYPVAPKSKMILLVAFVIGIAIPFGFYYLKDILYTKVRGRSDVTNVVKAPVLGEIPSKPKKQANQTLFVEAGSNNQISEAFRILRANLSFMGVSNKTQVIAMTSTLSGEGKSYIAMNLAMTFAISGKTVCMVDLDLRKMATSRNFKLRGKKGVSEYLAGQEDDLMSLIQTTPYENVSVFPGGIIPPNPAELLMSERFDKAIEELRKHFDYIILDNPPLGIVADTGIANRVVDITLYVIRVGKLDRRQLPAVQEIYSSNQLRNMAVVLTDIDYEALNYSMGYTGYGKYYGYRYYGHTYYNYYASYNEGESSHKHSYGLYRKKRKKDKE